MDKENAKREIGQLVEKFRKVPSDELDRKSEEQIKFEYIEPLLLALGWRREDIEKEQRVLKGRADYILKIGNQEVLVIEAKRTGVQLTEEEGRQAVSYAYHRKIKFAVLTNFKQVRIYHALSNIKNINKNLLRDQRGHLWINCESFDEDFNRLWLLSRESFEKGEANKLLSAKDERLSKPIDESILDDLLQYRDWLSKDLKKLRMYLSDPQIDEIVQILIDRLIFMRSVEDRGLEEKDFLLNVVKDFQQGRTTKRLWELLKEQFRIFNKTYNSKLFEEGLLEKEGFFDEDTLIKVIRGLYFGTKGQQERYLFDEIRGDLLGNIYEQYLGTILKGTEKRVKLKEGTGKRKKMGIYYTPSYIVDYIVKNTAGEYIKDKTIDEILGVRILDPACGSGSFLIRAFRYVCEAVEGRLKKGERSDKWHTFKDYKGRLNLGQKITILTNCIYGVDLDEKAVELAQLNLLLLLLEDETRDTKKRLLPPMKDNIKCGNSIIDDLAISDKAFNWQAQFPDIFRQGGFDVVIGNPPYGIVFKEEEKHFLEEHLPTFKRNNDLYVAFVERAINLLLKQRGLFSFIIPNTYLIGPYFDNLKKTILEKTKIVKIIDFGINQIFKDPNVFNSIIVLENESDYSIREKNNINFFDVPLFENLDVSNLEEVSTKTEIVQSQFNDLIWKPKNKVIEKINRQKDKILDEICYVKDIGFNYWSIGRGKTRGDSIGSKVLYDGERKNQKDIPFLKGRDINRYYYAFGNHWLRHNYETFLDKKVDIFRFSPEFLEASPKIIYRQTADRIIATIDLDKYYLDKTVHLVIPKENVKLNMLSLLGVLNSKLMLYFYRDTVREEGRTFAQVKTIYIKRIPLKFNEQIEKKISELVMQMLSLQKKYHSEKLAGREKELLEQQIKQVDWQINQEVYKLYSMTEEEKKIIEDSLK